jgi:hypothetical protein
MIGINKPAITLTQTNVANADQNPDPSYPYGFFGAPGSWTNILIRQRDIPGMPTAAQLFFFTFYL